MLNLDKLRSRPKQIVASLPPIDELADGAILADSSITLPGPAKARPRLILERKAVIIDQVQETQPAFAGAWLDGMPSRFGKQFASQLEAAVRMQDGGTIAPHFCDGQGVYDEDHVLLDLRAAYLQVFSRVCWDLEYRRGNPTERYFAPGTGREPLSAYPFDPAFKTAYACCVSFALPVSRLTVISHGVPVMVRVPNYRRNPSLVCFVSDVLHAIAWRFVTEFEACRVNTDSYLIPERRQAEAEAFLDWLGLVYHVKHRGPATVRHLNAWKVGDGQSLPYASAIMTAEPIDNLNVTKDEAEWITDHFQRLPIALSIQ